MLSQTNHKDNKDPVDPVKPKDPVIKTIVVAGTVFSYDSTFDPQIVENVRNAILLAQLAAKKKMVTPINNFDTINQYFTGIHTILMTIGFMSASWGPPTAPQRLAPQDVLATLQLVSKDTFSEPQIQALSGYPETLKASNPTGWNMFNTFCNLGNSSQFIWAYLAKSGTSYELRMRLFSFVVEPSTFLWFSAPTQLSNLSAVLPVNEELLNGNAENIKAKVGPVIQDYVF